MQTFDWIVVGNGLTGSALSYELTKQGCTVLLLDRAIAPPEATRYSYGGIPYWSGTTALTRQLCQEGRARHQALSAETGVDTELCELDLILTISADQDPQATAAAYGRVATPPQLISPAEAVALEPLLRAEAIQAALTVRHGHVNPTAVVKAYNQGFLAAGGQVMIAPVTGLVQGGDGEAAPGERRVTGVTTPTQTYAAGNVAIAAGGYTRSLLKTLGLRVPIYFTYAELLETHPLEATFRALIMPAALGRSDLESKASRPEVDALWDEPGHEIVPPILDAGLIQFRDKTVRIGQISRISTTLNPEIDTAASEQQLRDRITALVPTLAGVPGHWCACPVAFSRDGLPLAGSVPGLAGLSLFSGFNSPFALVPAAAVHFAQWAIGQPTPVIEALSPGRFPMALKTSVQSI
jgi:glycine/D-amino acid oxidase-like deaminating enzyme